MVRASAQLKYHSFLQFSGERVGAPLFWNLSGGLTGAVHLSAFDQEICSQPDGHISARVSLAFVFWSCSSRPVWSLSACRFDSCPELLYTRNSSNLEVGEIAQCPTSTGSQSPECESLVLLLSKSLFSYLSVYLSRSAASYLCLMSDPMGPSFE